MPWLTATVGGGSWVNAIGGTPPLELRFGPGQLSSCFPRRCWWLARWCGLSVKLSSIAAGVSLLIVALTVWYYKLNVNPPVAPGLGCTSVPPAGVRSGLLVVGCGVGRFAWASSPS